MAKIVKEKVEEILGEALYEIYEIVDAIDETEKAVKILKLKELLSENTVRAEISKFESLLIEYNEILAEIEKIKAEKLK